MLRTFLSCILFFVSQTYIKAQQLYIPRNIKKSYEKDVRSKNGTPGKNYWQNEGKYAIYETLIPDTKTVSGNEKIVYTNNSADTLRSIAIRFVNNVHKPQSPGLDITSFSINNELYQVNSSSWGTVTPVRLKNPILPHTSTNLDIAWSYPLLKLPGREGQIDSTTFYAAYSYPRVSVYDDYNGWDMLQHNGRQEFYNNFNDYELSVTVPKDYVVWATGDLTNADEVLQPSIAKRLHDSYTSDNVITIADFNEMQQHKVTKQNDSNTWKFTSNHITDVCWAASKNYVWDGASVVIDRATSRRVSVQSAYNDTAIDFHHYTQWSQNSLRYFSTAWPGVAYPFPKMTSFQGYADMEYPMMINDDSNKDLKFAEMVQDHEIAHTYFPFYMGINETRYAYMDEGWATTFEYLIGQEEFGKQRADSVYKMFRINRYINDPSAEEDQPVISMSSQVNGPGYGNNAYGKASLSYLALKDYLGDDLFKKALDYYMNAWHGKHPIPWDYFFAMNAGSGENLNWLFNNWFFSNNYIDLKIDDVKKQNGYYNVIVKNEGGFAIPFDVRVMYEDATLAVMHETPGIWKSNQQEQTIKIKTNKTIKSVSLDGGIFMDYTPADNVWKK